MSCARSPWVFVLVYGPIAASLFACGCTSDLGEQLAAIHAKTQTDADCPAGNFAAADAGQSQCEPCEVGTFCASGTPEPIACAEGTWDHDADPATKCEAWMNCAVGEYERTPGTERSDRECMTCGTGTFSRAANQGECQDWTECGTDESELTAGTSTRDRVCEASEDPSTTEPETETETDTECEPGSVQLHATGDGAASACAPCEAGQYCPGGSTGLQSCGGSTWDDDSDPATPCHKFTECVAGEYVTDAGSALADRACAPCADDAFSSSKNAASCQDFQRCAAGTFRSAGGTPKSDVECAGCVAGSFSEVANALSCNLWTDCQPGEFVSDVGSAVLDRSCDACPPDTYSSGLNFGACVAVGECAPGSVEVGAGDAGPPECEPCEAGQYCAGSDAEAVTCAAGHWDDDEDPATPCASMTPCAAGEYIAEPGDPLSDRKCAACDDGEFSSAINSESCEAWSSCAAGSYVLESGTSVSDRGCEECADATFSSADDAASCAPWTTCTAPSLYVANIPSATTDRVCTACEAPEETLADNSAECVVPVFQELDGVVSIEAEHFHLLELNASQHTWELASAANASGGECMLLTPDAAYQWTSPVGYAPRLEFRVDFSTTGTHYINLKGDARANGGASDSCFAAIDGTLSTVYDFDDQVDAFGWRQQTLSVDAVGEHIVSIWPSEDGLCIDKIVISTDAAIPTGNGPAESSEG